MGDLKVIEVLDEVFENIQNYSKTFGNIISRKNAAETFKLGRRNVGLL